MDCATTASRDIFLDRLKRTAAKKRLALSVRYPLLKPALIETKRGIRTLRNALDRRIARQRLPQLLPSIVTRHQSVLRRTLGVSDPALQEQKVINLQKAVARLDGLIIQPGQTFSLWASVGKPTYKKGYVDGMLLSNGAVTAGVGGGLCQLSNFLFWLLLHAPTETVERYHHSLDVFPDSGRTLPFGSGATVLYNFIDLRMRNVSNQPLQINLWLTDKHLKGTLRTTQPLPLKYSIQERNHAFGKYNNTFFRFNEIWRIAKKEGAAVGEEHITTNCAPVLYAVDEHDLQQHYTFHDFSQEYAT